MLIDGKLKRGCQLSFALPFQGVYSNLFHQDRPSYLLQTSMGKYEKLLEQILLGSSDANIDFDELCRLLVQMGFDMRVRGSHHIFRKQGVEERINLQRDGSKAKLYQVRQVRAMILRYKLRGETHG